VALICPRCGHDNLADANFCSSCGRALADVAEEPTESRTFEELEADGGSAVAGFMVRRGPMAGSRFELEAGTTSIGRHPEAHIFLDDITVSRQHAEVVSDAAGWRVRDTGSLNGTYVNRTRIDTESLHTGDEVQIGKFKLVFFVEDPGDGAGTAPEEAG
jgi:hypothetical protein